MKIRYKIGTLYSTYYVEESFNVSGWLCRRKVDCGIISWTTERDLFNKVEIFAELEILYNQWKRTEKLERILK